MLDALPPARVGEIIRAVLLAVAVAAVALIAGGP
jgi:hypothetical protein